MIKKSVLKVFTGLFTVLFRIFIINMHDWARYTKIKIKNKQGKNAGTERKNNKRINLIICAGLKISFFPFEVRKWSVNLPIW